MAKPLLGRSAALVGRDDELDALAVALHDARTSRGTTLFVAGEPGIGKTRLSAEALGTALDAGMTVLKGRCVVTGPAVPYRPLTEALMSLSRAGTAPPADALGPYLPVLGRLVPEWSTGEAGDPSPIVLAEAVLRLASACGSGRGCLLVIDDLHDADPETLAVVEYMAANVAFQPVVVVATVRTAPSAAYELANAVAQRREGTLLELGRLGADDVHTLAASCLDCPPEQLPADVSAQVFADSGGNPFVTEELLRGMRAEGHLTQVRGRWQLPGTTRTRIPFTLVRAVEQRAARLGPEGVRLLSLAAVLGRAFPLSVVRRCAGLDGLALADYLRSAVAEGLLLPDEERGPDWYAFEHPLTGEVLLSLLAPVDRAELSARAADAVDELNPDLPGTWCLLAARLRRQAGRRGAAAALYLEVVRRALASRGPGTAIAVLYEAQQMLGDTPDEDVPSGVHREVLEALLFALADDGQFDRAVQVVGRLRRVDSEVDLGGRVEQHVRLAWAAQVAGRLREGTEQVRAARALLPEDAGERDTAGIDVAEAYLIVSTAEQGRIGRSEQLARRAIEGAEQRDDHALACQAWYAVGFASRARSMAESDRCFRRTLRIATENDLMIWRNHGLIGVGSNRWLAEGDADSLAYAHQEALRTGCVSLAHNAGAMLALDAAMRSDFAQATALIDGSWDEMQRLQLHSVTRYALMVQAVVAAHQGNRQQMRAALAKFRAGGGEESREAPLAQGLAELFCALLEEDHGQADELVARLSATVRPGEENYFHFSGTHGLIPLLSAIAAGPRRRVRAEIERTAASEAGRMRWNRQFVGLAEAVLLGREGRTADAMAAFRSAQADAEAYPTARHLGLRLVADAALADRWGEPSLWLSQAEAYFHQLGVVAVAGACRSRLRSLGVTVHQRRVGTDHIPDELLARGITLREFDVFRLLVERLGNKAVAARLHISPRTVEKHIASLIVKTGTGTRAELCAFTAEFMSSLADR
jgi:DNA-binding CsgD family transcriptional regulator